MAVLFRVFVFSWQIDLLFLVEHRQSAIDHIRRSRDIVAVTRCQEDGKTRNVTRLAQASERDLANQRLQLDRIVEKLRVDGRLDRARRDAVDGDPERTELHGE